MPITFLPIDSNSLCIQACYRGWFGRMGDQNGRQKMVSSDENKETTEAIRRFVKGLYPEVQDGVIQAAVGEYFDSISQKRVYRKSIQA